MAARDVSPWKETLDTPISGSIFAENLIDILLRLPVKSVARFRCVCKSWLSLLTHPHFISMHLHQAAADSNGCSLCKHLSDSDQEIYSLRRRRNMDFVEVGRLEVPVPSKTDYYQIVGSSNGLICLTESNFKGSYLSLNTFLWNPAIREFRALPKYHVNNFTSPLMVVGMGFAFHRAINDYKVVRIVYFTRKKTSEADVFSLSTGSWRKLAEADIRCYIHSNVSRAFVNGALHWLAGKKDEIENIGGSLILSFDVAEEVFKETALPDFGYSNELIRKCVAEYKGCLAVLLYDAYHCDENCEVWVMEEYGAARSWTKRFTIRHEIEVIVPLEFLDDGGDEGATVLVLEKKRSGGFISWGPEGFRDLEVAGPGRLVGYVESLVSPAGRRDILFSGGSFEEIDLLRVDSAGTRWNC